MCSIRRANGRGICYKCTYPGVLLPCGTKCFSGGSRPSDAGGGGGGGGWWVVGVGVDHPNPEIKGGPGLQKIFFLPFGPQFGLKIRWGLP